MSIIRVEIQFTVQPAAGQNLDNKPLELLDPDGDRQAYVDNNQEAVNIVNKLMDEVGFFTNEMDLDGCVQ